MLEFRTDFAIEGPKKTMLLKTDGRIVDMFGNEQVLFHSDGSFLQYDSDGRPIPSDRNDIEAHLYVIVRHRNHTAVISDTAVHFHGGENVFVDFSRHINVLGGGFALKRIDKRDDGSTGENSFL